MPCKKSRLDASEQRLWRDGIYDQIREVMSLQGSLSVERMCQMARVSRRELLPVAEGAATSRGRDGSAIYDSTDCFGTSPTLRLSTDLLQSCAAEECK